MTNQYFTGVDGKGNIVGPVGQDKNYLEACVKELGYTVQECEIVLKNGQPAVQVDAERCASADRPCCPKCGTNIYDLAQKFSAT